MSFLSKLAGISAFVFDMDGVLTNGMLLSTEKGELLRSFSIRDGYAIQLAIEKGYHVAVITGGHSEGARNRLARLGIKDVFMAVGDKLKTLETYLADKNLSASTVLYMGDDIPDYQAMKMSGLPVCPADAAEEIKDICKYISSRKGGAGAVRDVIEQVLKVQGNWIDL